MTYDFGRFSREIFIFAEIFVEIFLFTKVHENMYEKRANVCGSLQKFAVCFVFWVN